MQLLRTSGSRGFGRSVVALVLVASVAGLGLSGCSAPWDDDDPVAVYGIQLTYPDDHANLDWGTVTSDPLADELKWTGVGLPYMVEAFDVAQPTRPVFRSPPINNESFWFTDIQLYTTATTPQPLADYLDAGSCTIRWRVMGTDGQQSVWRQFTMTKSS